MKIIGSLTSPFVRFVRVVCEELNIPYEMEVTLPFNKMKEGKNDELIRAHNPLMKVPALIDGENEIVDSRIIVGYLTKHSAANANFRSGFPADLREENILTVILGVTDAGVLRFMMKASHPEIQLETGYMARSLERIKSGFQWLDRQPRLGQSFGVTEAALMSTLEWMKKRAVYDWNEFPNIVKMHKTYCERPSLVKTRIPESA
jgi:glutathione S-transferase